MSKSSTHIIVNGASGRMGTRILALALDDPSISIDGATTRGTSPRIGTSIATRDARSIVMTTLENASFQGDSARVVIDFSSDDGAMAAARFACTHRAALLVGTTAMSARTIDALTQASSSIAVMVAPNTSTGVAVIADAVMRVAKALGPAYECSIVEAHHSAKKDAPSGTAKRLANAARAGGAAVRDDQVLAMRGGDVIGEHTVRFAGPGEYVELTHRATSRDLFARGALRCAAWLSTRAPGWYTMEDMLLSQ
jgi:4-hydroxy-tetrahydrodipicolinate reductase